ncbi:MAG: EAL domain-containing protein [Synergistaceae bacterium]|nr:EAL domain-containing protein [Synergistaceae bacterium]
MASIVSLARSLHFTALGECVEMQEQKERLHDRGCTRYQGCLFSRALSLDDLLRIDRSGTVPPRGRP